MVMVVGPALTARSASVACVTPTVAVPRHEPRLTRGPTELVSGLYVQGGAFIVGCPQGPRGPFAGTLSAISTRTGKRVARETLTRPGKLFVLTLAPGSYLLRATDAGGLAAAPVRVTIPAHRTVRQDVFIDVP
jgi:hypothetical protein